MPIHHRIPIEQQATWRIVAGMIVTGLFAAVCVVVPVYLIVNAQSGGAMVWGFVLAWFWLGAIGLLVPCKRCWAELRARRIRRE
jgi:hypothetical protein